MSRPNNGKTSERGQIFVSRKLKFLLIARKNMLANDGQRFAKKASIADISDDFVDYFFKIGEPFKSVQVLRKEYNELIHNKS